MEDITPFQPYNLTPLDHVMAHVNVFMFLQFDNTGKQGIDTLKQGIARLIANLPFLAGNVIPSSQPNGKERVFEVQPATASFLHEFPMLQVQEYPELDCIPEDDWFNPKHLPMRLMTPPEEPSPVIRFKANVTKNTVILSFGFNHLAMDATGSTVVIQMLSECCRNPEISADGLSTSVEIEEASRQRILNNAAAESVAMKCDSVPMSWGDSVENADLVPRSRRFALNTEKLSMLRDVCNAAISGPSLTCNDILTAIAGMCGHRARRETMSHLPPSPKVVMPVNARRMCSLPPTYIGNVICGIELPNTPAEIPSVVSDNLPAALTQEDLDHLRALALSIRTEINNTTPEYVQRVIRNLIDRKEWSMIMGPPGNITVSSMRWMDFYLDFGTLGKVRDCDIPFDKLLGLCMIMPSRNPANRSEPYEVRFCLEQVALERLQQDSLWRWLCEV